MQCPDCNNLMRKHGAFYTCERCGLSLKPWEIEQAQKRARAELDNLSDVDADSTEQKKKRRLRKYRNWYEGKAEVD